MPRRSLESPEAPASRVALLLVRIQRNLPTIVVVALGAAVLAAALIVVRPADAGPAQPAGVKASVRGGTVVVRWHRVHGAKAYVISRCRVRGGACRGMHRIARVSAHGKRIQRFRDRKTPVGGRAGYAVRAIGGKGRRGPRSKVARVRLPSAPAPSKPRSRAPAVRCTTEVGSAGELQSAVRRAAGGATVCLRPGNYPAVRFDVARSSDVTVAARPGETVTLADLDFGSHASHIRIQGLHVESPILLDASGANHIAISWSWTRDILARWGSHDLLFDHNLVKDADDGIALVSQNCTIDGAPERCAASQTLPPVSNVVIRGNKIVAARTDAMVAQNFRNVIIEGNEVSGLVERGQHSDALQTVWGGQGLVYRRNYVHDNAGTEGFFAKDGRIANLVIDDNLFVDTFSHAPYDGPPVSFYNAVPDPSAPFYNGHGATVEHNTIWNSAPGGGPSGNFFYLMGPQNRDVAIHRNVTERIDLSETSPSQVSANGIAEDYNLVGETRGGYVGAWGRRGPHDVAGPPHFVNRAADDYRLRGPVSRSGVKYKPGVTWRPAAQHYGP